MDMPKRRCGHTEHKDGCRICFWLKDPSETGKAYRTMWGWPEPLEAAVATKPDRPAPRVIQPTVVPLSCVYLGGPTGEVKDCATCGGGKNIPIYNCAKHGSCTTERFLRYKNKDQLVELKWCKTCKDRLFNYRKHLLFHMYPRKGSYWTWHCQKLLEYNSLFTGKRVIAIAVDNTTDTAKAVKEALKGFDCEFIEVNNHPDLREVVTHLPLFTRLTNHISPEDVTLYAHSKGVTNTTWPDGGRAIRLWTEVLYETLLDYWPVVHDLLTKYPIVGSLKRRGHYWPESSSSWHYSGSWFWFRNRDLYRRDWSKIDRFFSGIEPYPSLHFADSEAGVVFGDLMIPGESSWPYKIELWDKVLIPELIKWRTVNQGKCLRKV